MIQLSSLPATSPENPVKTASSADRDSTFATRLHKELGTGEQSSGKVSPDNGKELPDALPEEGKAAQVARNLPNSFAEKMLAKVHGQRADRDPRALDLRSSDDEVEADDVGVAANDAAIADLSAAMNVTQASALIAGAALAPAGEPAGEVSDSILGPRGNPRAVPVRTAAVKAEISLQDHAVLAQASETAEQVSPEGKPFDQAPAARDVKSPGPRVPQELRVELSKGETKAETAAPRAGQATLIAMQLTPLAAQSQVPDSLHLAHGPKQAFDGTSPQLGVRPQDFSLLVDRLVEARESSRSGAVNLSVMHADFGEVSLRFNHENGNLSVSMASHDPDFARAVSAAAPTDGSHAGETPFQGGRRDDGGAASSSRMDSGAGPSAGEGQSGRNHSVNQDLPEQAELQAHSASRVGRVARGGIYA